jgi:hypothetical protein
MYSKKRRSDVWEHHASDVDPLTRLSKEWIRFAQAGIDRDIEEQTLFREQVDKKGKRLAWFKAAGASVKKKRGDCSPLPLSHEI